MTQERDFDRLARAWLELGPDEAPDRAIAAVLQAVDTTPQVRRRWFRLSRRFPIMNRLSVAVAVAAALVIAVGGGAVLLNRPSSSPGVGSSPSPSPSVASPSLARAPVELVHAWLGEVVESPELPAGRDRAILQLAESTVELVGGPARQVLLSDIRATDAGTLELVSRNSTSGCTSGDVGRYTWSLSPGGSLLELMATADDCATRQAAFEGTWQRSACRNPDNLCLGDLEAGTYKSQFIGPRLDEGEPWTANFGALTYTVPEGWSSTYDYPDAYVLMPTDDYATSSEPRDGTKALIQVYARPAVAVQDETCAPLVEPGTGRSVDELIGHIIGHPGLSAGESQSITIDGHAGRAVDVEIAASWTGGCPDLVEPLVILFTEAGRDMTTSGLEQVGLWNTQKARLMLLDLGDGDVVLIIVSAADGASFEPLIAEAMPIVESFTFE
jgi:hypothetical protein